ncbi:MAG: VOC family protein [Coriobacteriia bacterium]|nr:VOC family protein [Coriobacteriia bacterium]
MKLRPHHVGLVVSDLARSTAFYEALGFGVASDLPSEDGSRAIRFLELDGFSLELFWYAEPDEPAPAPAPAGKGQLGFRHLALHTDDLAAALGELKTLGFVPADLEIRVVPIGFKLVFLNDPDGVEIELIQEA